MELTDAFAILLKQMRLKQGLTQGYFGVVNSRTYLILLECINKKFSFRTLTR